MGVLDDVKSLAKTVQQIDNVALYRQILDLQGEIMDLVEENRSLKQQLRRYKRTPEYRGNSSYVTIATGSQETVRLKMGRSAQTVGMYGRTSCACGRAAIQNTLSAPTVRRQFRCGGATKPCAGRRCLTR